MEKRYCKYHSIKEPNNTDKYPIPEANSLIFIIAFQGLQYIYLISNFPKEWEYQKDLKSNKLQDIHSVGQVRDGHPQLHAKELFQPFGWSIPILVVQS